MFCRGYEVESWLRFWTRLWILSLVEMLMFGWNFEVDAWSRFWRWNLIKICVWVRDMTSRSYFGKMNSIPGSVVPLAMFWQTVETIRFLLIVYYLNFHFLPILEDMLSASCLWQIPGWCDEARDVINCSNIQEAAKNLINWSLFVGIPQIFIAALYQVLIPLEICLKPKQFVFNWCSKYIGNTSLLREMKLHI